jgi:hypothetical protein
VEEFIRKYFNITKGKDDIAVVKSKLTKENQETEICQNTNLG